MSKPILVLDFDGVIHGYQSGWKGAANIPDPPVPGAQEFIVGALDKFEVHILSSRSHQWGGRRAMKRWLWEWLVTEGDANPSKPKKIIAEWWQNYVDDEEYPADATGLAVFITEHVTPFVYQQEKESRHHDAIVNQTIGEGLQAYRLEKLARYETHLDRKFERTLAMLIKLKDLRSSRAA